MRKLVIIFMMLVFSGLAMSGEIHQAAADGNLDQLKNLLAANPAALDEPDNTGKSPLHNATYAGQIEVARYLIEQGANINALTGSGSTPLHGAAFYGHREAVDLLIASGADVNIANSYGYTPLLSGSAGGHLEIAKKLITAGSDVNARTSNNDAGVLLLAGASGNQDLVDYYLDLGFDVQDRDVDGEGLLHYAAFGGNLDLVKRLVGQGINVNIASTGGVTPLHYAAQTRKRDVVEYLLEQGADVNNADDDGGTAIHRVMSYAREDSTGDALKVIKLLVANGADINIQNKWGQAPVHWTIYGDHPDWLRYIIEIGGDLNLQLESGYTPLHLAIMQAKKEHLKLLLSAGARTDIGENHKGLTPLHQAAIQGDLQTVMTLLPYVAEKDIRDKDNHCCLYYAAKYGHKQVADLLRAKGAKEVGLETNYGYARELTGKMNEGEASLWYLGHCGWAIKTKNHLLIFDYWERAGKPTDACLANGCIMPGELKDQNVTIFVSHEHQDHFDSTIFCRCDTLKKVTYVFGFHPEELPEDQRMGYKGQPYKYIDCHTTRMVNGMEVTPIKANDAGQGFLVCVDGLNIYHAGDHAGWREGQKDGFTSEIDFLDSKLEKLDFAFVNVTGCHVSDTVALAEATYYTLDKLSPKIMVPTHGIDREYVYKEYADKMHAKGYNIDILCPEYRGDKYIYKEGQIM